MSSTSSSHRPSPQQERSPTESLASRYRHLFVLPSKPILLAYAALLSVALSLVAGRGALNLPAFALSFLVAVLASATISATARLADPGTIATFRRATAVIFAGDAVWLFCLVCGLAYSFAAGSNHPLGNALIFGTFISGGFEFIIINGAFTTLTSVSLALAAIHPLLTLAALELAGAVFSFSAYAAVMGLAGSVALVLFVVALKQRKTDQNYDAIRLFQAFMKTWAGRNAADLEAITARHAERAEISSKVMRFHQSGGDIYIVLPGVHPGPFYPVGSYNLPSLMYRKFSETSQVLTLHGPGSHERNLATTSDTQDFVSEVYRFAQSLQPEGSPALLRGPIISRIGRATVSSFSLSSDVISTVSFAPFGSEDLEAGVEEELSRLAQPSGLRVSVVDAHNSIEPRPESLDMSDPAWGDLLGQLTRAEPTRFRVAYANSHEIGLGSGQDLADGGLSLFLMEAKGKKWALVLADSNNAAPSVRDTVAGALEVAGYSLLEFCTSDSHELSARGMTVNRGYLALGEATSPADIAQTTVRLARAAESRLADCSYGSGTFVRSMNTLGTKALDQFERVARSSARFAKRYTIFAAALILLLLLLALVV